MAEFRVTAFRRTDPDWPVEDMAALYAAVQSENKIVRAGGLRALNYEYGPNAWCLRVEDSAGKCVGGCIFEFWNEHVDNCLSIVSAMILPEFRHTAATNTLWKTIRWFALGCQWICTTHYKGNNTYVTKYREIKL